MKKAVTCCLLAVFLSGYLFGDEVLCKNKNVPGCLLEIKNKPECFIPNNIPEEKEEVTWSGDCKNKRPIGRGSTTWVVNGEKKQESTGEMFDGYFQGTGKMIFYKKGVISAYYNGDITKSRPNGKGVYEWVESGYVYTGNMKNGKANGYGVMQYGKGVVYKGSFVDGWEHGQGEFVENGKVTKGCFEKGYFLGKKEPCGK